MNKPKWMTGAKTGAKFNDEQEKDRRLAELEAEKMARDLAAKRAELKRKQRKPASYKLTAAERELLEDARKLYQKIDPDVTMGEVLGALAHVVTVANHAGDLPHFDNVVLSMSIDSVRTKNDIYLNTEANLALKRDKG